MQYQINLLKLSIINLLLFYFVNICSFVALLEALQDWLRCRDACKYFKVYIYIK